MRRITILIALATAACESSSEQPLRGERAHDDEVERPLDRIGTSRPFASQREQDLERKVDELTQQVARLEAELAAAKAVQPAARPPMRPTRRQPDVKDVYAVPVDGDPVDGPADALVTIVEGYEYGCPYCNKVQATLDQLRQDYGNDLRIVKKAFVVHPTIATTSALAACAADRQGKFAEMDQLLWDKAFDTRQFDDAHIQDLAKEAGLDLTRYQRDIAGDCVRQIQNDQAQLQQLGQTGTPTFYVNGRYLSGAQPIAEFKKIIDQELKTANDRVASGTSRSTYYRDWVLDRGLPKFVP